MKVFIKWAYIYLDTVTKSNNINLLTKELSREENSATSSLFESVFSPVSSDKQTDRLSKSYLKALNKNSKVITKPKTPNINPAGKSKKVDIIGCQTKVEQFKISKDEQGSMYLLTIASAICKLLGAFLIISSMRFWHDSCGMWTGGFLSA